jgi:hypothetical protein
MHIILLLVTHTQWDLFHKNEIIAQEIEFHKCLFIKRLYFNKINGKIV